MNKTEFVRARIEPDLKVVAEAVLNELGMTPTQAVNMLYRRIARDHAWPLELKVPNMQTRQALEETDQGIGLLECKDLDDLFGQLGI